MALNEKMILALDQGTTSSRAMLFNHEGQMVTSSNREFSQLYPRSGWVEHDPMEIWSSQASVAAEVIIKASIPSGLIAAIGITNQRETTIVWNRRTGKPIYNAIVWQDRRTAAYCDNMKEGGYSELIRMKTGLIIDAYFSASKINWILEHVPGARNEAEKGLLAFGTVDSWLVWNLTGGKVHVTDVSNASRTMLFNIQTLEWDEELLQLFRVPLAMLPKVCSSSEIYGETSAQLLSSRIPISGIAGDQQAALFGQMCTEKGMVKNTYGTGCFMLMNIGNKPVASDHRLITTIAWKINDQVSYAFEGSVFIGGAVVQWLRDGLGIISSSSEVEILAAKVPDSGGVFLVPAFAGLGAPHWNQHARGTLVGITRGTNASHIARASLESIAYQTLDVLKAMEADAGEPIAELRVDGGASVNNLLMQIQADILGTQVIRPEVTETTSLGAAYLAGLAVGYWKNIDEIKGQWKINSRFSPAPYFDAASGLRQWGKALKAANAWATD